jgi:hypothetical protein
MERGRFKPLQDRGVEKGILASRLGILRSKRWVMPSCGDGYVWLHSLMSLKISSHLPAPCNEPVLPRNVPVTVWFLFDPRIRLKKKERSKGTPPVGHQRLMSIILAT